jgi:hypothetical protein
MAKDFSELPKRLVPYILMTELNEPVAIAPGPFRLVGTAEGTLDADLYFRWVPSVAIAFGGSYSVPVFDLGTDPWTLESDGPLKFSASAFVTHATLGSAPSDLQGFLNGQFAVGETSFQVLRFSLANFPEYIGAPVRYESNGSMASPQFECRPRLATDYAKSTRYPRPRNFASALAETPDS